MNPQLISEVKLQEFDAVIFDYGGVLVRPQNEADQACMATLLKIPGERFAELYWAHRLEYDKGDLTAAAYWSEVTSQTGTPLSEQLLKQLVDLDTRSWMQFDDVMWNWIGELRRAGKRTAMLSNMPMELGEALKSQPKRLELFDQVTLSYQVRAAKPEPLIYEHCLEGLDMPPERALFFDDRIENVQGAELLGIRAVQFLDRDAVLLQVAR